tara:strand:+ start:217 stop:639 length:423 start_codon:yes stop_codon:yes gene_type:complete
MSDINTAYDTLVESQQKEILQLKKEMAELKEDIDMKQDVINMYKREANDEHVRFLDERSKGADRLWSISEELDIEFSGVDTDIIAKIKELQEEVDILIKGVTGTVEGDEILDILKRHLDPEYLQALIDSDDHDPLGIFED